jgi:hypothetical protein
MSDDKPIPLKPLPGLPAPESLQLRISKMILKEFPQLIVADADASGQAVAELAAVMGAIMAPILVRKGVPTYREALRHMVTLVDQSAKTTAMKAATVHSQRMGPESKH